MIRSFLSNPSRLLLATWFIATLGTGRSQTQEADPLQDSLSLTPSAWAPGLVAGTSAQFQLRFFTDAAGWNGRPVGLWSDGTTIWSSDWGLLSKLFAYSISGARDHAHDFDSLTPAGNRSPRGIWSDGKTMWVCDDFEDRLFAYDLSTTTRQPEKEFDSLLPAGNTEATGIWSDGTIMWVADAKDTKIYAYDLATTQRLPNRDINNLEADGNLSPSDIWSNGTTLYVADKGGFKPWSGPTYGKIFAYDLATGKDSGRMEARCGCPTGDKEGCMPPKSPPPLPWTISHLIHLEIVIWTGTRWLSLETSTPPASGPMAPHCGLQTLRTT
jgi:hypothetical protein